MNDYFYRGLSRENSLWMNDPRGYISPYYDAYMEGEVENKVLFDKYMHLTNNSKVHTKIRCNGILFGRF